MSTLLVIVPGSRVHVGNGVEGCVESVCLKYGGYVSYNVKWWDGVDRREDWFQPDEITLTTQTRHVSIGFPPLS